jgi:hypothetical protein
MSLLVDFANDVVEDFLGAGRSQFGVHAAEGDADDVAVVEFGAGAALAEVEPQFVGELDVLGPQSGRVRAEVEEDDVFLIFEDDLQRK